MSKKTLILIIAAIIVIVAIILLCTKKEKEPQAPEETTLLAPTGDIYEMVTTVGTMKIQLYNETPKHSENFAKLVADHYYDSLLFHRVIKGFMIQGGDPDSRNAKPGERLGSGGPEYRIPAEFNPRILHQKGALAAARDNNPEKASSGSQFYIVQDEPGCKSLNGNYTVFGLVIEGIEIVDKIASVQTDANDRPMEDVRILSVTKK